MYLHIANNLCRLSGNILSTQRQRVKDYVPVSTNGGSNVPSGSYSRSADQQIDGNDMVFPPYSIAALLHKQI